MRGVTTGGPRQLGVVYDVDGVLRIAPLRRQWGRLRALVAHGSRDRRSLLGMQRVLGVLAEADPPAEVYFLTALPARMARPLRAALRHDQYPAGTLLTAGRSLFSGWLFGAGLDRKRAALDRLAADHPNLRWVLVGDDAGHDPQLFADFARDHPGRVAAIAMRRLLEVEDAATRTDGDGTPVVGAPNGEELLPGLRAALDLDEAGREPRVDDWFLTEAQRGNPATRLRGWTEGNDVHLRVHGSAYYRNLAARLATTGPGDQVLFLGWRGDGDQRLGDDGPTVSQALADAVRRGARVCGLLWRSHLSVLGYHVAQNRRLAAELGAVGAEVLLDQRIRPLGSHHQKLVVIRHDTDPRDDVAYVGGIDLVLGARDDIAHRGDPQSDGAADAYDRDPRHDAMLELHGPVVRDLHEVFFERWVDPTPLVRLPWHVIPDLVRRLPQRAAGIAAPAPDPPASGSCAVQVLRTYPRRTPPLPYAPWGERSVARAFIKALGRARRLVYVEDQYLWSADVARVFAAALRRAPDLHLIAVVPRPHRDAGPNPAMIGQAEAMGMVHEAGGDRVQILDVENDEASPVYVHAKVCVIDDVWATVGSNNFNTRSWTHDSELVCAVLDAERDGRAPADPGGLGDGARGFARRLRLELMREHLGLGDDDTAILDPDAAADVVRTRATELDAWHAAGARGERPPGRLRRHTPVHEQVEITFRRRWLTGPAYRMVLDPDGRPLRARLQRTY